MATGIYIKDGQGPLTIDYTCTGAVAVNTIQVFGDSDNVSVGMARTAGATGDVIAFDIGGCYRLPAVTGAVIAQGETVNWDSSAGKVDDNTHTATTGDVSNFAVALDAKAAASTATTIDVQLLPGNGAIA